MTRLMARLTRLWRALLRPLPLTRKAVREPFTRQVCDGCGKVLAVTKAGRVWVHKCRPTNPCPHCGALGKCEAGCEYNKHQSRRRVSTAS